MTSSRGELIRVAIVDDHAMVAEALVATLNGEPDIDVVGRASSVLEAIQLLDEIARIDVLLMDHHLPDGSGIAASVDILARQPAIRIILLTTTNDEAILDEALRAGCAGYVSKAEQLAQLVTAVRAAHAGAKAISPLMLAHMMNRRGVRNRLDDLTPRERSILVCLAEGLPSGEISSRLNISGNTLRNHTQNILTKLNAHSRLEAVAVALRDGIISIPEP
jgi:DNA-binding NarL/FixJ family response regulator